MNSREREEKKKKINLFLFNLSQVGLVFNTAFSPLQEHPSLPAQPERRTAPAPRKSLAPLAKAAGSTIPELVSLAGIHASAAPAGGNSLLTSRGGDKWSGREQQPQTKCRERGAQRERTGGGCCVIQGVVREEV